MAERGMTSGRAEAGTLPVVNAMPPIQGRCVCSSQTPMGVDDPRRRPAFLALDAAIPGS